ncbi:MAG: malonyl-CoA O-methyltransferase [Halomonas sp. HL-48]|nr:methyltransferase domain-containing protein [Halomonas sp. HL-48]KPQ25303.1 MAG: malonyl-CoA O-methyltransferase [Halomonas sp. HL-48]
MSIAAPTHDAPRTPDWQAKVARAFSRAAPRYDALASAQRHIGESLWARLPAGAGPHVLDLGCGTGYWTQRLALRYPDAEVAGLDIAPGMLAHAEACYGTTIAWHQGDATAPPFADGAFDLVFSNLAIQWCRHSDAVMQSLHRVLAPGGQAHITTLLPGTLCEVADAWQRPEALLTTPSAAELECAVVDNGLRLAEQSTAWRTFHYPDLNAVMASIKGVGAQVARANARLTRGEVADARARYDALREPEGLPVSYHCLTLHLEKTP